MRWGPAMIIVWFLVLGMLVSLEIFQDIKIMYITNNLKVLLLLIPDTFPSQNIPKNLKMKQLKSHDESCVLA